MVLARVAKWAIHALAEAAATLGALVEMEGRVYAAAQPSWATVGCMRGARGAKGLHA